jgi:predicted dienelactone hydrolase
MHISTRRGDNMCKKENQYLKIIMLFLVFIYLGCKSYSIRDYIKSAGPFKIGISTIKLFDKERDRKLIVELWYPSNKNTLEESLTYSGIFPGVGRRDAEIVKNKKFPLILFSHGTGGNRFNLSWLAEYLASQGYIVGAVDHPGDMFGNSSPLGAVKVWVRPTDIIFVIDELLKHKVWKWHINQEKISAAGHSSGGYTVLALAGAKYNPELMDKYCKDQNAGSDCNYSEGVNPEDISNKDLQLARKSYHDSRIKSAVALAPAVGQGFDEKGLSKINIPVLIVATKTDEITPYSSNAGVYIKHIKNSKSTIIETGNRGHFIFMSRCNLLGKVVASQICDDAPGINRSAIHENIAKLIFDFFEKTFNSRNLHSSQAIIN